MSKRHVAAFFSGVGTAIPPAWMLGLVHGEQLVYGVGAVALAFLFGGFVLDKSGGSDE